MKNKIVTIHQPNFMPWLGFFSKIEHSDIYIVLDHVANKYNEQSWFRRVKLANKSGDFWFSVSVKKPINSSHIPINKMTVNTNINYTKLLKTIKQIYSKTPYFNLIYPIVEKWFLSDTDKLSERNIIFIKDIINLLNIKTEIITSSNLNCIYKSNEMLIEILKKQNSNIYLSGNGAEDYQEDDLFQKNGIKIVYSKFKIKPYRQINTNSFIGGLSIIDPLMNIGPKETKKLL